MDEAEVENLNDFQTPNIHSFESQPTNVAEPTNVPESPIFHTETVASQPTNSPEHNFHDKPRDGGTSDKISAYWKKQVELKDVIILELGLSLKCHKDATPPVHIIKENETLKKMVANLKLEKDHLLENMIKMSKEIESLKRKLKQQAPPMEVDTPAVKKQEFVESQASSSSTPIKNIKQNTGNVGIDSLSIPTFSLNMSGNEEQATPIQNLNIPPKCMLTKEEMTTIQILYEATKGGDDVYWDNRKIHLSKSDIIPLSQRDFSSDKLMDVWSYFLTLDHSDMPVYIFPANLWPSWLLFKICFIEYKHTIVEYQLCFPEYQHIPAYIFLNTSLYQLFSLFVLVLLNLLCCFFNY